MPVGTLTKTQKHQDPQVEKHRGRYYGRFMAFVRDRDDPSRTGRVRVYCPAIIPEDSAQHWLDWCMPTSAGLAVPPIGAPVWVEFEQGQVTHGVYTWGWLKGETPDDSDAPEAGKEADDPTWPEAASGSTGGFGGEIGINIPADTARTTKPVYPYNKVFKSEGGAIIELDDSPGLNRFRYRHPSGTTVLIDSDGSVHFRTVGAVHYHAGGDFNVLLKQGSTFKVAYPDGAGIAVGSSGITLTATQVRIMGRTVLRSGEPIK